MNSQVKESDVFRTYLKNNICYSIVKSNAVIELKDAEANTFTVKQISKGKIYPILVDIREIKEIKKEARDHFTMKNRVPGVLAIAILINSPLSKIIGNFFMGINKPSVPSQLFTSEEKAIAWLSRFK